MSRLVISLVAAAPVGAVLAAPALGAPLPDPAEAGRYAFGRSQVLPTPNLTSVAIREGRLSGLQVVPGTGNRRFVSVSDRRPNGEPEAADGGRTFLSPSFAPVVYELEAAPDGSLDVVSRLQLRVPGANPLRADPRFAGDPSLITGIRNVVTPNIDDA